MNINYALIAEAVTFYESCGYKELDVPWLVSLDAVGGTLPLGHQPMHVYGDKPYGCLVGSAEQSFMHMMEKGDLKPGRWCAVTPCFRDEQKLTETTRLNFMKVELILQFVLPLTFVLHALQVQKVWEDAVDFFTKWVTVVTTETNPDAKREIDKTYDIELYRDGLELGSYGFREWRGHRWVYGTGVAEPRMSIALSRTTGRPNTKTITTGEMISSLFKLSEANHGVHH